MSIRIMTAVWDTQLPDSEKIVLLALADCANDEGLCWPSMATLTAKCSKSDRTIQAAIKSLAAAGHLTREERPGKGCRYTIHPARSHGMEGYHPPQRHYVYRVTNAETGEYYIGARTCLCAPEDDPYVGSGRWVKGQVDAGHALHKTILEVCPSREALAHAEARQTKQHFGHALCRNRKVATPGTLTPYGGEPPKPLRGEAASGRNLFPPKGTTPTPEAASDKPSRTITSPPVRAKALPTPAGGSGPAGDDLGEGKEPKAAKSRKRAVGSRLSEDWQASAITDLPLEVQAVVGLWPAGAYELTAIMFRNHWLAEGRAIGAKRDWSRTWHNWLLRENMTILRAVKAGQRFDATAPAVATRPAPAESAAAADVLAQKVGETEQVRQIRRLVRLRMGPAPYDSWLKVSAIEIRRGEVRVTSPTTFQASWVEQHFALPLREAAQEVLGEELRVRVGVARPSESKAA